MDDDDVDDADEWHQRALTAERALARIRALAAPEVRCPMPGVSRDAIVAILREAGALAPVPPKAAGACAASPPDQHWKT